MKSSSRLANSLRALPEFRVCIRSRSSSRSNHSNADAREKLAQLAAIPLTPISLDQLMSFGNSPLSKEALVRSAELTRSQLPHRIARRVRAHESLPAAVQQNTSIKKIKDLYLHTWRQLHSWPEIKTVDDSARLTDELTSMLNLHSANVSTLSRGFKEARSRKMIDDQGVTEFLDKALRNRIGIRLIGEQHIALHKSSVGEKAKQKSHRIGILDRALPVELVLDGSAAFVAVLCEEQYDRAPEIEIEGDLDATFPYVEMHLQYIFTEILKNAFRATCEHHVDSLDLPPIKAHISVTDTGDLVVLIRDEGGGIPPESLEKIWSYGYTTVKNAEVDYRESGPYSMQQNAGGADGESSLAGQGFGLKLSRLYCSYFGGGSLMINSEYGKGTEVEIRLCQGTTHEH